MLIRTVGITVVAMLAVGAGCDRVDTSDSPAAAATAPGPVPASAPVAARPPRVVFVGDSLTAGMGVDAGDAFPAAVAKSLEAEGHRIEAVNAGVSGDTTAGGLRRLDWLLRQKPDVVVVGLGANDGLRGLKLEASEQNLRAIVARSKEAGAKVLLLGMLIPPNYGPDYTEQFASLYPRLSKEMDVALVPFALEGVGGEPRLNQPDGIHPTPQGHRIIAANVLPHLKPLLPSPPGTAK